MVGELLGQTRVPVSAVYGLERWAEENAAVLAPFSPIFNPVTEAELKKISAFTTPQAVLAVADMPPAAKPGWEGRWALFLDGIRDPGNFGTMLRIADWFGLAAVYGTPDCVDMFSPKVVQASMGAVFRVPVWEIDWAELQALLPPGTPVMGAVLDGVNVFDAGLPEQGLLVIGSEGSGIRREVEAALTHRLTIPKAPDSRAESLNASVAAGILTALLAGPKGILPK